MSFALRIIGPGLAALLTSCAISPDTPVFVPNPSIAAPSLRSFVDGKTWVLERDLIFRLSGREIVVPAGFVTDLASVPRIAESLRSRIGTYSRAAILHDWIYWTGLCPRDEADRIFYQAMRTSGSTDPIALQVYRAVVVGGQFAYQDNADLRAAEAAAPGTGERRLVDLTPDAGPNPLAALDQYYWPPPGDPIWPEFRRKLRLLPSPARPARAEWCDLGIDPNQRELPRAYRPRRR